MPKKVVTRRQRKAAEAKRLHEEHLRFHVTDPQIANGGAQPLVTLDPKAPCCCCKPEVKAVCQGTGNATRTPQPTQMAAAAGVVTNKMKKPVVTEDKMTQSERKMSEPAQRCVISKEPKTAANVLPTTTPEAQTQTPVNEQVSFSKSLTRRAVATFNKIQKLSKAFNKKMNNKPSPTNAAEPAQVPHGHQIDNHGEGPTKASHQCGCEFCKVVISQMFATNKRQPNSKKGCMRPGNRRRSATPSPNFSPKTQQAAEDKFEDCQLAPQSMIKRQRILELLEARRKMKKNECRTLNPSLAVKEEPQPNKQDNSKTKLNATVQKTKGKPNNKGNQKAQRNTKLNKKNASNDNKIKEPINKKPEEETPKNIATKTNKKSAKPSTTDTKQVSAKDQKDNIKPDDNESNRTPNKLSKSATFNIKDKLITKAEFVAELDKEAQKDIIKSDQIEPTPNKLSKSATFDSKDKLMKTAGTNQLSGETFKVPPPKILGNTGYFILTGTDAQLAAQLDDLAARNIHVEETMLLQTGITDKLEAQLEELMKNYNEIQLRMRTKELIFEPARLPYKGREPKKYK